MWGRFVPEGGASDVRNRADPDRGDEAGIRQSLEGVLADEGYSCVHARDGADALSRLKEVRPSLVLLDIWMPGMDGIETLRRIKEIDPAMPVVMMSGHATISTAIRATKEGAADFIEKPLEIEALLSSIRRALPRGRGRGPPRYPSPRNSGRRPTFPH